MATVAVVGLVGDTLAMDGALKAGGQGCTAPRQQVVREVGTQHCERDRDRAHTTYKL